MSNAPISWEDVRVDVYRSGIGQPVSVRVTHVPTGLVVTRVDRSEVKAREAAKAALLHALPPVTETSPVIGG